jgi:hypothetical protein
LHARRALGNSLKAIEIGNEPNDYPNGYATHTAEYFKDFETYRAAIEKSAPGVKIVATDDGAPATDRFTADFVANEKASGAVDIVALTNHNYPASACGSQHATIPELLSAKTREKEQAAADGTTSQAKKLGVPGLLDEGNSVVCQGEPGVSDVFASALWALDYQLLTAREGVVGNYFHGNALKCGSPKPLGMFYTPLCAETDTDAKNGTLTAQPEYYGMLAARLVGTGNFTALDDPGWADVRAFAVRDGGHLTVVLDNIQDPSDHEPTPVTVNLGSASFRKARAVALTSPQGLQDKSSITLGGKSVGTDGHFPTPVSTSLPLHGDTLNVDLKPGSALIIKLS